MERSNDLSIFSSCHLVILDIPLSAPDIPVFANDAPEGPWIDAVFLPPQPQRVLPER